MDVINQDQNNLEFILKEVVQHATNFFNGLEDRHVSIDSYEIPKNELSNLGIGASATLEYFTQYYAKGLSRKHWFKILRFCHWGLHTSSHYRRLAS